MFCFVYNREFLYILERIEGKTPELYQSTKQCELAEKLVDNKKHNFCYWMHWGSVSHCPDSRMKVFPFYAYYRLSTVMFIAVFFSHSRLKASKNSLSTNNIIKPFFFFHCYYNIFPTKGNFFLLWYSVSNH